MKRASHMPWSHHPHGDHASRLLEPSPPPASSIDNQALSSPSCDRKKLKPAKASDIAVCVPMLFGTIMKTAFTILISLLSCVICWAEPATFPTKEGKYTHKGWEYVYEVQLKGTRSEKRIGRLFLNGKEIKGKIGELHQESIGIFIYFGEGGYNQGWLNTLTYDEAVFSADGSPTPKVTSLLKALRDKKTKAEQGVAPQSATRPESKPEGGDKPQPESKARPR